MSKPLIIVESPTKAKTISRFLGGEFQVEASMGHVRDLPKSKMSIDTENGFVPTYIIPIKAKETVAKLKKLAKAASKVILATDEDREGEAISWHLVEALDLDKKPLLRPWPTPAKLTSGWWMPSKPGACSTGWSAMSCHLFSGAKFATACLPGGFSP